MSRSASAPPSPSPRRRPPHRRRLSGLALSGAVILALILIAVLATDRSPAPPPPAQAPDPVSRADAESMILAAIIKTWLDESREALAQGRLLAAYELQQQAETAARNAARQRPDDEVFRELPQQAEGIVFQFEKYGGAPPPQAGQTASPRRYPNDAARPGADEQINDLFVSAWADEKRGRPETALGLYHQALDRLDQLLRPGQDPAPAPAAGPAPLPPPTADRTAETRYLKKYYAVADRLAALESGAGREDQAEAVRRRALAAIDQGLARGVEAADVNQALDSLLANLAQRERFSGRLESARLSLQRRLGLKQYLMTRPEIGAAPTADDDGLGSAQLPPPAAPSGADPPAAASNSPAALLADLAWLDRHTFHYDEGLEYLTDLLEAAERAGQAALSETDRLGRLIQGEMLMDLGRFQAAELALQQARPNLDRLLDGPRPAMVGRVDIEPRVTSIRANLALSELALAQADPAGAQRYMEEAVLLYRTLPGGHPVTFDVQLTRVKVLARQGDSQRAERELTSFLVGSSKLLDSPVDIWVKRQILALMAEAAWQARARGESSLSIEHYKRVNDELTPYITGIDVDNSSEYGSLFRPILVEIMEGEGDLWADLRQGSQAESRYVLGLDMARALRDQEPRQYFWRSRFDSLAGKVERYHY